VDTQTIVILDFGSQYTQLIARRIREQNVFSVVLPCTAPLERNSGAQAARADSLRRPVVGLRRDAPAADPRVLELGVPVLGICYGLHFIVHHLGGKVRSAPKREYGHAEVTIEDGATPLFAGLPPTIQVWMSHGDEAEELPAGFRRTAVTRTRWPESPTRSAASGRCSSIPRCTTRRWAATHQELRLSHLRRARRLDAGALHRDHGRASIREKVGEGPRDLRLSGGVDSSVAAVLVHKAIGEPADLHLREQRRAAQERIPKRAEESARQAGPEYRRRRCERALPAQLAGVTDPETKRKRIGAEFIAVFDDEATRIAKETGGVDWLVQGTLYPDVIESSQREGPEPDHQEPPQRGRPAGADEAQADRAAARSCSRMKSGASAATWACRRRSLGRQPFPGPGLAVRILGEVTPERVALLQEADEIVVAEIKAAGLYNKDLAELCRAAAGDERGRDGRPAHLRYTCAVRAVHSEDGMTADWTPLPYEVLKRISSRIVNEVRGINRVVYDITSKPPGTIEWESASKIFKLAWVCFRRSVQS
jgi:GMP synthase (glutamine-hydrolysing)